MGDREEPRRRRPGKRKDLPPGGWMDKAYPLLGAFLRELRESLGLTQQELADRSLYTAHPFDRSYVAHIETGRATELHGQFLNYLAFLFADTATVLEIMEIGDRIDYGDTSCPMPELLAKVRTAAEECLYGKALSFAIAGITRAEREGMLEWVPKFQLSASIVFRFKESWLLAKRFAEEAVNAEAADNVTRFRAANQLVCVCLRLDELQSAESYQRLFDEQELESVVDRAFWWHERAKLDQRARNFPNVEHAARTARTLYEECGNVDGVIRASCVLSQAIQKLGRGQEARELAAATLESAQKSKSMEIIVLAMTIYGHLLAKGRIAKKAKTVLFEAERLAMDYRRPLDLFEARVYLLELGLMTSDRSLKKYMSGHVESGLHKLHLRLDPDIREHAQELLARFREDQ